MEPPKKLVKTEEFDIKEMLLNMQSTFLDKLKNIEDKIEKLGTNYHFLEEKVEDILIKVKEISVGVPLPYLGVAVNGEPSMPNLLSSNTEESYPNGSWLGDPDNPNFRVRCNISPIVLETLNSSCASAEKMALTLLDHLFDREMQAVSNISGTGKHGKKQLDPIKVYGIKCHIMYMFGVNQKDWLRIRQNLDSKCRTAFRKKLKGMPLTAKGCSPRLLNSSIENSPHNTTLSNSESSSVISLTGKQHPVASKSVPKELQYEDIQQILPIKLESNGCSVTFTDSHTQIIHTEHGDIQVIQATEEQLEQLKHSHHIEILSHADVLPEQVLETAN